MAALELTRSVSSPKVKSPPRLIVSCSLTPSDQTKYTPEYHSTRLVFKRTEYPSGAVTRSPVSHLSIAR